MRLKHQTDIGGIDTRSWLRVQWTEGKSTKKTKPQYWGGGGVLADTTPCAGAATLEGYSQTLQMPQSHKNTLRQVAELVIVQFPGNRTHTSGGGWPAVTSRRVVTSPLVNVTPGRSRRSAYSLSGVSNEVGP
ncbi:unnamed protein product, partial [Iphiclides podalirius]